MATEIKLPELGEGVTEGELVKWLVKVGDAVKPDQAIVEIMTDKATVEVPTPMGGVVRELKFKVGDTIPVESILILLDASNSAPVKAAASEAPKPASAAKAAQSPGSGSTSATVQPAAPAMHAAAGASSKANLTANFNPPPADFKTLATPATRRLAREMGVDINSLSGSGLAGRVTRDDVAQAGGSSSGAQGGMETYAPSVMRQPARLPVGDSTQEERVPLRGVRKKIAENLQMAKHIIPHFTLMDEAVVSELIRVRESVKDAAEAQKIKVTYLPFVMKALIATCRQFPAFNASIDDQAGEIVYKKYFNVGFATDTPNGLLVPVIKNADTKTILQISQEITDLATRAREGKLKSEEMKQATITITNIGSVGGTYATPIINHPEVAILGMYKISDKVIVGEKGEFKAVKVMNFSMTCDHRLIDGAQAGYFLRDFIARIQNPGRLMLDMI